MRGELAPLPMRRSRAICGVSAAGGRLPDEPPLPPLHDVRARVVLQSRCHPSVQAKVGLHGNISRAKRKQPSCGV